MVRVTGKVKYRNKAGYFKINENFRSLKEAKKYRKFLGKELKEGKITYQRKKKRRTSRGLFDGIL